MADLGAGAQHHPEHREFGQRRGELLDARAELAAVEGPRDHGTAAGQATRGFGVVVREHGRQVEAQRRLAGEELDGLGAVFQEGVHAALVVVRGGLVLQVGLGGARRLLDALLFGEVGAGDPQPAARARGGAAELRLFVHHQHVQPLRGGRDGGGHARCAGTDHQYVDDLCLL